MSLHAKLQHVSKPRDVQARVDGGSVDAELTSQQQEGFSQDVNVYLQQVAQVQQHVWRPLGATHQVEAGGNDVLRLSSSRQVFADDHLEEVEGRVQTVLIQLQLTAQLLDLTLTALQGLGSGLFSNTGVKTRTEKRSLNWTVSRDKLSHSRRHSSASLHKLDLRDDDVVLQNRTTAGAHRAAPGLIHVYI